MFSSRIGASTGSSASKESTCNARDSGLIPGSGSSPWRRDRLPTPEFLDFPVCLAGKESAWNVGDLGSIPGLGRSPGEGHGNPLQHACLENFTDRGAWWATVHGGHKELNTTERLNTAQLKNQWTSNLGWT